jgi:hypothetical protein
MIRFVLASLTFLTFLPPATALATPSNRFSARLEKRLPAPSPDSAYRITDETETLLDGRKCPYEKVPNSAKIILMEIDSEASKVVLRIHFQSQK